MDRPVVESRLMSLSTFDELTDSSAEAVIRAICTSERWVAYVVRKRPYRALSKLMAASDEAIRMLSWPDIEQAMPARPDGSPQRDSGPAASAPPPTDGARIDSETGVALKTAAAEYEEQFGHGFLICDAGRSSADVLGQLRLRLAHSRDIERRVVRAELLKTVRLRLAQTFEPSVPT